MIVLKNKKWFSLLLALTLCVSLFAMPAYASANETPIEDNLVIQVVTPEEMDQFLLSVQSGISPQYNLFSDLVLVTMERNPNGSATVRLVNAGMPLDRIDLLSGVIFLHDSTGTVIGKASVEETHMVFGVSRNYTIYPLGGSFDYASYTLTLTDGGQSWFNAAIMR